MENDNAVQEFVKNSIRLLRVDENQENNIRKVIEFYQNISSAPGSEADMIMLFNGIQSIKIIVADNSIDPIYNLRTLRLIEDSFEKYFEETRYPSEKQQKIFQSYVKEKVSAMKAELDLIEEIKKQQRIINPIVREIHNPRGVYFNSY